MAELLNSGVISMGTAAVPQSCEWLESSLSIPEEIRKHISRITRQLHNTDEPLTENHLWESIAANASPAWVCTREDLLKADANLRHIQSDEQVSLGLIGDALDGEDTVRIKDAYSEALAAFVLTDETLRCDTELQRQLNVLHTHWSKIETSIQMSRAMLVATREMEKAEADAAASSKNFSLKKIFSKISQSFTGSKPTPDASPLTSMTQTAKA
jgi:hypothetical protein